MLLEPGMDLTLRPMRYPKFFKMYKAAIENTWTVEELEFSIDVNDLKQKMNQAEVHLIHRLVAFFATGDTIVANNLVLNLYKHINAPEARLYLSRQLFEEALHVETYLLLLDTYISDDSEREAAFAAIHNIPSIKMKADFMFKWIASIDTLEECRTKEDRKNFLMNLICFASCVEGLFFFGAFAYVYYLRSRGLLPGLAAATNFVFKDETLHMDFAFSVIDTVRAEEPDLWDEDMDQRVIEMLQEAIECEYQFAEDVLQHGLMGLPLEQMREYLEYVADERLKRLGIEPQYDAKNPFAFLDLQNVQEFANFFEKKVSAYQLNIKGEIDLDADF